MIWIGKAIAGALVSAGVGYLLKKCFFRVTKRCWANEKQEQEPESESDEEDDDITDDEVAVSEPNVLIVGTESEPIPEETASVKTESTIADDNSTTYSTEINSSQKIDIHNSST